MIGENGAVCSRGYIVWDRTGGQSGVWRQDNTREMEKVVKENGT